MNWLQSKGEAATHAIRGCVLLMLHTAALPSPLATRRHLLTLWLKLHTDLTEQAAQSANKLRTARW